MFKLFSDSFYFANRPSRRRQARNSQLWFEHLEDRQLLASLTVSSLADSGVGSLREAIIAANGNGQTDTIDFSVNGTINLSSQLPTITDSLTITGPGQTLLTIDAGDGTDDTFNTGDGYRVFNIDDGNDDSQIDVTLSGLTLTGGDTANAVDVSSERGDNGGAIQSFENLTVSDSTITGNATGDGGGITGGLGGGIYSAGTLTVTGSTISDNRTGNGGFDEDGYSGGFAGSGATLGNGGRGGGIASSGTLTVTGSTISGNATGDGGSIVGDAYAPGGGGAGGIGGGIYSTGTQTIIDSNISDNTTGVSEGGRGASGGGIYSTGTLTIDGSNISGNTAGGGVGDGGYGGGVLSNAPGSNAPATLTITNSTVSGNTAGSSGGGIRSVNNYATLTNSTVSGNTSTFTGGGIFSNRDLTLNNSTVSGNTSAGSGGGIRLTYGGVTLVNSTVSGNSAAEEGGGITLSRSTATLINSTVSGNMAGSFGGGIIFNGVSTAEESLTVRNSIIAGNFSSGTDPDFVAPNDPANNLSVTHSIIGTALLDESLNELLLNNNLVNVDFATVLETEVAGGVTVPLLADNGGPVETIALLPSSPAIDAGDNALAVDIDGNALLTDQRGDGFDRIVSGAVDIGAFEFGPTAALIGDVDQNGLVNLFDIAPFIDVITSQGFQEEADIDQNGVVDLFDIAPFIELLTSGQVPVTGPTTFTVTNTSDAAVTAAGDSPGSLRQAIFDANALAGADTITFDSSVFTGGDASLIRLTSGELEISDSLIISASSSLGVTITGDANGDDITTAGNITDVASSFGGTFGATDDLLDDNSPVINFSSELGELTVQGLTITGGRTTGEETAALNERTFGGAGIRSVGILNLTNSEVSGNSTTGRFADGGGILAFNTLTLNNSTVDKNSTSGRTADGGGIAVLQNVEVTLTNSTVSGNSSGDDGAGIYLDSGNLTLNSSTVAGNVSGDDGGGIALARGDVALTNSTVSGNTALRPLASSNSADGGGIFADFGYVTLTNSTVSGNTVSGSGGGIYAAIGGVTLTNSTVSRNTISGYGSGGGIHTEFGDVALTNSTVSGNTASGSGGGIYADSGDVTLTNSTVSGNTASGYDGVIYADVGSGGGIHVDRGSVTLTNSTVSGNTASGSGGGIYTVSNVTLTNSTISGNTARGSGGGIGAGQGTFFSSSFRELTARNSIIAGNMDDGTAPNFETPRFNLTVQNSIIGDTTGISLTAGIRLTAGNSNKLNVDFTTFLETEVVDGVTVPLLTDNGGPVETIALLANSPAIDAGDNALAVDADGNPLLTDQRGDGFDRIFSFGTVDIGAYESEFEPSPFMLGDIDQNGVVNLFDISPFIGVITSQGFQDEADINQDGVVDLFDIAPFIGLLTTPATNNAITQSNAESSADLLDTAPESLEEIQDSERDEVFEELLI